MAGLIEQLQAEALDSTKPIADLLRKALVVAKKLGISDFENWISAELNGYRDIENIPPYREVSGVLKGYDPSVGWIPAMAMDEKLANALGKRKIKESISNLESLVKQSDNGYVIIQYPSKIENFLMKIGSYEAKPGLFVGVNTIEGVLDTVRNMVLMWALKLEQEGIIGEGMNFSKKEQEKAANNTSIHIGNFQGIIGNANNSIVTQNLTMTVQKGDFDSLSEFLVKNGISEEDIGELKGAIESDPIPQSKTLGEHVGAWFGKMVSKAASGIWKLGVDVATNLLASAIWAFYGIR